MSTLAMQVIQQALVTKLTGDALLMDKLTGVYDTVPQQAVLPYLEIDLVAQESMPTIGETVWRVNLVLNVWTPANGRKTALSVLDRLQALLHYGTLTVSGYTLHEMRIVSASCELGSDGQQVIGSMEIMLQVVAT